MNSQPLICGSDVSAYLQNRGNGVVVAGAYGDLGPALPAG